MERREFVLAGLAPANGSFHSPVQVQKLFFLLDRNAADQVGGPYFDFQPYNYGPFDSRVYEEMEALAREGLLEIAPYRTWRLYRLTPAGQDRAVEVLASMPSPVQEYIHNLSRFVLGLNFTQLVRAIYKAYPEMRQNSVFQE